MITLTLPFPPSVNSCYRAIGRGRSILSKVGRTYRASVLTHIAAQGARTALLDRLAIAITLHPPDKRRRDVDNYLKAPLDALTHAGVWADDSQIDRLTVTRGDVRKGGAAIITIGKPEDFR